MVAFLLLDDRRRHLGIFEWSADHFLLMDMQKDSLISSINSVYFDPNHSQKVIHIPDITETIIHTADGATYTVPGYLDIGLTTPWAISSSISSALPPSASSATSVCATPIATKASLVFDLVPAANRTPPLDDNYAFAEDDGFTDGIDENGQPK